MIGAVLAALICLTNDFGSVAVDTLGANVMSYVPRGGGEVLFRQKPPHEAEKWYHGGVPVCWPAFHKNGGPGMPVHGFARMREWRVTERREGGEASLLRLRMEDGGAYRLDYEVRLGRELSLRLEMRNLGTNAMSVTTGLHPYFLVSSPDNVTLTLPCGEYKCSAGEDKVLKLGDVTVGMFDRGTGRRMELEMSGGNKLVLWNPGQEYSEPGETQYDWKRYLCVEPAVLPAADALRIGPGELRTVGMVCRVVEQGYQPPSNRADNVAGEAIRK